MSGGAVHAAAECNTFQENGRTYLSRDKDVTLADIFAAAKANDVPVPRCLTGNGPNHGCVRATHKGQTHRVRMDLLYNAMAAVVKGWIFGVDDDDDDNDDNDQHVTFAMVS